MSIKLQVTVEPPKMLTATEEATLLRVAVTRAPDALPLRMRLVSLCLDLDLFDEVIGLLAPLDVNTLDADALLCLTKAYFEREAQGDVARAGAAAKLAADRSPDPATRAVALSDQARAAHDMGEEAASLSLLSEALAVHPGCRVAQKLLIRQLFAADRADDVLLLVDRLWNAGAKQARLLGSRTIALARLGQFDEARAQSGVDQARAIPLEVPPGWPDMESFNAALAAELLANPGLRYDRQGVASRRTWRVDTPQRGAVPALATLHDMLRAVAESYADSVDCDGAWQELRPARAELQSWSVQAEATGYERWHLHPHGWISGGYYIAVPESVVTGSDEAGCIALGLAPALAGDDAARHFGERLMRPQPGSAILFPSHTFHRTYPHFSAQRRICLAFDVVAI